MKKENLPRLNARRAEKNFLIFQITRFYVDYYDNIILINVCYVNFIHDYD